MLHPTVPLVPKDPQGALRVMMIGRISTDHQREESIEASFRYVEDHLQRIYNGPLEIKHLGEQASGMRADRRTIREAEDLIATGEWDLVIAEDLSRIFRNPRHQYNFVQDAVDAGTRLICIADNLDTAEEQWELMLGAATLRHGLVVSDTRRRVRRTATHAFRTGGMVQKVRYGYRRLTKEEAASGTFGPKGLAIAKRPECTPIIQEMRRQVLAGRSYEAIADWAKRESIEIPQYATGGRWTGRLIRSLLMDPILSGRRTFRKIVFEPVYRTGRHRRRPNPQPESQEYPELAHLSREEHDELLLAMQRRAQLWPRAGGLTHPRFGLPRSRAIWPAQHARCAICGKLMYQYNEGQLKCSSVLAQRQSRCWNHVQVSCDIVRQRVITWLLSLLLPLPGFWEQVSQSAREEYSRLRGRSANGNQQLPAKIAALELQAKNLASAIALGGELQPLVDQLHEVNRSLKELRGKQRGAAKGNDADDEALEELLTESAAQSLLLDVAAGSFDFADLLRQILPEFVIQPVQALDTPLVRPRGYFSLRLGGLDVFNGHEAESFGEITAVLDLFEPPLHIRHLSLCVEAKRASPESSLKQLAQQLGINHMTVKRALDYCRRMHREGLNEPYRVLHERPRRASRWRTGRSTSKEV